MEEWLEKAIYFLWSSCYKDVNMEFPTQGTERSRAKKQRDWTLMESLEALDPTIPNITLDSGLHEQFNSF